MLELRVKVQFGSEVFLKLPVQVLVLWLLWPAHFPVVPQAVLCAWPSPALGSAVHVCHCCE